MFFAFLPVNNPVWIRFRDRCISYLFKNRGAVKVHPLREQLLNGGLKTTEYVNFHNDNIKADVF